jgi:hypothetical protein
MRPKPAYFERPTATVVADLARRRLAFSAGMVDRRVSIGPLQGEPVEIAETTIDFAPQPIT